MGWTFTYDATRADIIAEITRPWARDGHTYTTLAHSLRGTVLWSVIETTDEATGARSRIIGCDLLRSDRGYGWGHKAMSEAEGPGYYTCPLRYLEMVPPAQSPYATAWRAKVRAYHAQARRRLTVGQRVALVGARVPHVDITSIKPLRGIYAGVLYRIPRRLLGDIINPEAA